MKNIIVIVSFVTCIICNGQEILIQETTQIDNARKITSAFLKNHSIPGLSVSVSKNNKLIWSEGFGFSDLGLKKKVNPNTTLFRLASISKPITAVGLAILADRNKLNFDESLYTYLPSYPKKKYDFTIRQVGGHLAGIRHYKGREFISNKKMTISEGLNIFKNDPLISQPGVKYRYSTYGWNLLSAVIEEITKKDFTKFMTQELFEPLEMQHTLLDLSDRKMPNRTQFYRKTNQNKIIKSPIVSNEHKVAGGGFIATSEDLIRFGNEIIDPKVIKKESLKELLTAQKTKDGKSTKYGIGFVIGQNSKNTPVVSHSGGGAGASTLLLIYPEEKVVIAIVCNLSQVPIGQLSRKLERLFLN